MTDYYTGGPITLTAGSANFSMTVGVMLAQVKAGDLISLPGGRYGVVASVLTNTTGTLDHAWPSPTVSGEADYKIYRRGSEWNSNVLVNEQLADIIATFEDQASGRVAWNANRTYYVRSDGSDANDGLTNSAGGAKLTIQAAINAVLACDLNGYDATISIGAGTFTGGFDVMGPIVGAAGANPDHLSRITISGAGIASTIISIGSGYAIYVYQALVNFSNLKISGTSGGTGLWIDQGGTVNFANIDFACGTGAWAIYGQNGAVVVSTGNWTVSSAHSLVLVADRHAVIVANSKTVTLTGTPAWGVAFAYAVDMGLILSNGNIYSGAATGKRYNNATGGWIDTGGSGANYFPGNVAGTGSNYA